MESRFIISDAEFWKLHTQLVKIVVGMFETICKEYSQCFLFLESLAHKSSYSSKIRTLYVDWLKNGGTIKLRDEVMPKARRKVSSLDYHNVHATLDAAWLRLHQ